MSGWEFDEDEVQGGNGVYINAKDVVGHLLLVWSLKYLDPGVAPTKFNEKADCIVIDVVDLDQNGEDGQPGLLATGQRWYQSRLIGMLKGRVGRADPILAFMDTEPSTKGNPAFVLVQAHSDQECRNRALAWRARNQTFVPGQPQPTSWKVDSAPAPAPAAPAPGTKEYLDRLQLSQASAVQRLKAQRAAQSAHHSEDPPPF